MFYREKKEKKRSNNKSKEWDHNGEERNSYFDLVAFICVITRILCVHSPCLYPSRLMWSHLFVLLLGVLLLGADECCQQLSERERFERRKDLKVHPHESVEKNLPTPQSPSVLSLKHVYTKWQHEVNLVNSMCTVVVININGSSSDGGTDHKD